MARRSNGRGSFYQQKDKSWVYQVTYGRKEDGKPSGRPQGTHQDDLQGAPGAMGRRTGAYQGGGGSTGSGIRPPRSAPGEAWSPH